MFIGDVSHLGPLPCHFSHLGPFGTPHPPTILGYLPDPHETSIFGPAGLRYLILGVPAELLTQERNPPEARKL